MTCRDAQTWLLAVRRTEALPAPIRRHLGQCRTCQRCQNRLRLVDDQVKRIGLPPSPPDARARLWKRIDALPPPAVGSERTVRSSLRMAVRALAAAAAAFILVGSGWILACRFGVSEREPPLASATSSPYASNVIFLKLVKHASEVAQAECPEKRLAVLIRVCADLKDEAIDGVQRGCPDDAAAMADLYATVIREGILRQAALVAIEQRPAKVAELANRFRLDAAEVQVHARESAPLAGELLRPMEVAAREAVEALEAGRFPAGPPVFKNPSSHSRPMLAFLVQDGLKLADESDALRRADRCAELIAHLTPIFVLLTSTGDPRLADELGKCLGDLLERGVAANLERVEADDPQDGRLAEAEKVRARSLAALAALEDHKEKSPPSARNGLERALSASSHGRDKLAQPGKAKGKPSKPGPPPKSRGKAP